jgi:hypothetical protein
MHKMGVQSPAELGRAVEWLGEIFESASAQSTGANENVTASAIIAHKYNTH